MEQTAIIKKEQEKMKMSRCTKAFSKRFTAFMKHCSEGKRRTIEKTFPPAHRHIHHTSKLLNCCHIGVKQQPFKCL